MPPSKRIPTRATREFVAALQEFTAATLKLDEAWQKAWEDLAPDYGAEGYPESFKGSFEDISLEVIWWKEAQELVNNIPHKYPRPNPRIGMQTLKMRGRQR